MAVGWVEKSIPWAEGYNNGAARMRMQGNRMQDEQTNNLSV